MHELSNRFLKAQLVDLNSQASRLVAQNNLFDEDISSATTRIQSIGLLELGKLRACWCLHPKPYQVSHGLVNVLVADVMLATAFVARVLGSDAMILSNGIVEMKKDGRVLANIMFVSGSGSRNSASVEAEVLMRLRQQPALPNIPTTCVATGVVGQVDMSPPVDVILDDQSNSIVFGGSQLKVFLADQLRANAQRVWELVA